MKTLKITIVLLVISFLANAQILINENFDANTIPTGWVPYTVTGTQNWQVGQTGTLNGNNLTGSLIFNDNAAGDTAIRNNAAVASPLFNLSSYFNNNDPNLQVNFTMHYFFDTIDSDDILKVLLFNPTNSFSKEIYSQNIDFIGGSLSLTLNLNTSEIVSLQDDIQLVIFYDDVNASWGWGAGIDSINLSVRPINDFLGGLNLTVGSNFAEFAYTANNFGATNNSSHNPSASCGDPNANDIWFSVIVPDSGNLTIETEAVNGSPLDDTIIAVNTGTFGNLTEIACNDDNPDSNTSLFSKITLTGQNPGETLFINMTGYNDATPQGEFQISAYDNTVADFNDCATPLSVTVGTTFNDSVQVLDNTNFTSSGKTPLPSCMQPNFGSKPDMWLNVVVPANGNLTIESIEDVNSNIFYSSATVYSGTCNNLTEIACASGGNSTSTDFFTLELTNLTPGANLLVRVIAFGPFNNGVPEQGSFKFAVYNDATANTQENTITGLSLYPNPVNNTLTIATQKEISTIKIYNHLGQLLKNQKSSFNFIDFSNFNKGIYFIKVNVDNKEATYKIIKK